MKEFELPHDHGNKRSAERLCRELSRSDGFDAAAELFRQMSDPVRVRIFWILSHREECVINISAMLGMSSPAVSHHLRQLKECGIIESRREGKEVYYRVNDGERGILLHDVVEKITEIACPLDERDGTREETVKKVHDHLLEHLDERITIAELSRSFHVNPTTLKQSFREYYGNSIAAHVNEHRMERAAELLSGSEMSIAEIASAVGFLSQSRFGEAFKEKYSTTPAEFRAKTRYNR